MPMTKTTMWLPLLLLLAMTAASSSSSLLQTVVSSARLDSAVTSQVDATVENIYQFEVNATQVGSGALRLYALTASNSSSPLMVVVRHAAGLLSWQLPIVIESSPYFSSNRTLCTTQNGGQDWNETVFVSISTASVEPVPFTIVLYIQRTFELTQMDVDYAYSPLSPSAPVFFKFVLPIGVDVALFRFSSPDDVCMTLSVQNLTCPVYDLDRNVEFEGLWQTVDRSAGLTLSRSDFAVGVFVVMVVKGDDSDCRDKRDSHMLFQSSNINRQKSVSLRLERKISEQEYIYATFGALAIFLAAYVAVFLISCVLCINTIRLPNTTTTTPTETERLLPPSRNGHRTYSSIEEAPPPEEDLGEEEAAAEVRMRRGIVVNGDDVDGIVEVADLAAASDDSSLDETDIDLLRDADFEKDIFRTKTLVCVADLARKSPKVLSKKSQLYHWNLATMAIFYGLPVIQLMLTYANVTNSTGNQDLCYFNFLCAHPLGVVTDFNHIYSNLGYVLLGALFMLIVWRKAVVHRRTVRLNPEVDTRYGIPQHFGMYYAMGLALMMEGVMSGCYHVCPNHTNFQFDTAFMYTISMLILLKIYQTRHPDINANAYSAFGALAFVIFVGVMGVLYGNPYFWFFFVTLHVVTCLLLSGQIYFMGRWRVDAGLLKRVFLLCVNDARALYGGQWRALKPLYPDRLLLLLVLNAANWSLDIYGIVWLANTGADFASFLLSIFISNVMLYTLFYLLMKLRHGERIAWQPAVYTLVSCFTWAGAIYFFVHKSTSWAQTPARSRHFNSDCRLFHFYDNHDVWHFLSAASLFLGFMILLTIDDDLGDVPRDKIPVF